MIKKAFLILMILLVAVPLASAVTEIRVRTFPGYPVIVTVAYSTDVQYQELQRFNGTTDANGRINFVYEEGSYSELRIITLIREGQKVLQKVDEQYPTGSPVTIKWPDWWRDPLEDTTQTPVVILESASVEEVIAESVAEENSTESLENSSSNESIAIGITGASLFDKINFTGILSNEILWYVLIGIVGIGFIFFLFKKISFKRDKKLFSDEIGSAERKINEAKRELRMAQRELEEVKGRSSKIVVAEQRLEKDQEVLKALKEFKTPLNKRKGRIELSSSSSGKIPKIEEKTRVKLDTYNIDESVQEVVQKEFQEDMQTAKTEDESKNQADDSTHL